MKKLTSLVLAVLMLMSAVSVMQVSAAETSVDATGVTTLKSVAITGVVEPVAGAKPVKSANSTSQYVVDYVSWYDHNTRSWMQDGENFVSGHTYSVNVNINAKTGYKFDFDNMTATVNGVAAFEVSSVYGESHDEWVNVVCKFTVPTNDNRKEINIIELSVVKPEVGDKPNTRVDLPEGVELASDMYWYNVTAKRNMTANETFAANKKYSPIIKLKVKSGYKFIVKLVNGEVTPGVMIHVNGDYGSAGVSSGANYEKEAFVDYTFPALVARTQLEYVNVNGFVYPTAGEKPFFGIKPDRYYTLYDVVWKNDSTGKQLTANDTYVEGVNYTLQFTLKVKDPYGFTSNTYADLGDGLTFHMSALSNDVSPQVAMLFAATFKAKAAAPATVTIDSLAITGITEPAIGETVSSSYNNNISGVNLSNPTWSKEKDGEVSKAGDKFEAGYSYIMTIFATAADGYKFKAQNETTSSVTATVNGKNATVKFSSNSVGWTAYNFITIYIKFDKLPEPQNTVLTKIAITNVAMPKIGESCKPSYDITYQGYDLDFIKWYNVTDGKFSSDNDKFESGKQYDLYVFFKAKEGYEFRTSEDGYPDVNAYVNNIPLTARKNLDEDSKKSIFVQLELDVLREPQVVSEIYITGVDEPVVGATPDFEADENEVCNIIVVAWVNYTDSVYMENNDKFEAGKVYGVILAILANYGYKFDAPDNSTFNYKFYLNGKLYNSTEKIESFDLCDGIFGCWYFETPTEPATEPATQATEATEATEPATQATEETKATEVTEPAHEHVWGEWEVQTPATEDEDGVEIRYDQNNPSVYETREIPRITSIKYSATKYTYNGKAKKPSVSVMDDGASTLKKGVDYDIIYPSKPVDVGLYVMSVVFKGKYAGISDWQYTIVQAKNPMTVTVTNKSVKYSTVKKKNVTVTAIKVSKAQGTVSYKKVSGNAKITVDKKTGKLTVKKGLKKGTYKVKVKVTAKGTKNYKSANITKTVTIKVK